MLAEDVVADRASPEFASSAMDGFAVRSSDVAGVARVPVELKIVGSARIGRATRCRGRRGRGRPHRDRGADPRRRRHHRADRERRARRGDRATIFDGPPAGQHIRPSGEDVRAGQVLVPAGQAPGRRRSSGCSPTPGSRTPASIPRPRVIVLSTGDELIRADRDSRSSARSATRTPTRSSAALREVGAPAVPRRHRAGRRRRAEGDRARAT